MMDLLSHLGGGIADLVGNLGLGLGVALSLKNLALCFLGCLIGTLIGVLPGVGPIATITMLLPITFGIDPVGALIMLAGIYYGAQYGGSTTAILVNIPGEATSVVTALDGHEMAKQGRAGVALGIAALGSFFAGCVATIIIAALATPLTKMALLFGPADYFSLMVLGLMFAVVLARGSVARAIAVILVGVLLSTVGTDLESGEERLTFGWSEISDGLEVAVLAMGLFGFAEILKNLESKQTRDVVHTAIGHLLPNRAELRQAALPIVRGTFLGSLLGLLPGNGAVLGPFASYTLEKKLAAGQRVRMGGLVEKGSLQKGEGGRIDFAVTDTKSVLKVTYSGVLPDLFREGQGVVTEGRLETSGVFTADTVLAKHDETYMPSEVAKALKDQGVWQGDAKAKGAPQAKK